MSQGIPVGKKNPTQKTGPFRIYYTVLSNTNVVGRHGDVISDQHKHKTAKQAITCSKCGKYITQRSWSKALGCFQTVTLLAGGIESE